MMQQGIPAKPMGLKPPITDSQVVNIVIIGVRCCRALQADIAC